MLIKIFTIAYNMVVKSVLPYVLSVFFIAETFEC